MKRYIRSTLFAKGVESAVKITKKPIKASTATTRTSSVSFDFINDGEYNFRTLESAILDAVGQADVYPLGFDVREVDYSGYPEYEDQIVTQGGVDFEWEDSGLPDESGYIADDIESFIADALEKFGYELIGIDFYAVDSATRGGI